MMLPASYQCATPFGVHTGGVDPTFFSVANSDATGYAQYDSWLTVGLTEGDPAGLISSIGIDWEAWTADSDLEVTDGAVFWMNPGDAPGGRVATAQLTVAAGSSGTMVAGMQGQATTGEDWQVDGVTWTYGAPSPPSSTVSDYFTAVVTAQDTSLSSDWDTYTMSVDLNSAAANAYTLFGKSTGSMLLPPAYQCATPFGANTGGTNPAFWPVASSDATGYAQYDSWLSVGLSDGDAGGALSSIGINWELWTELNGVTVDDGAVFWMSPDNAPGGSVVVAQLTVPAGSSGSMTAGLQGRSTTGTDWQANGITWPYGSGGGTSPPPPPPPSGGTGGGSSNDFADAVTTAVDGAPAGWTTYRMSATLKGTASNAYTIYGKSTGSLSLPAAYQCATPFGANTGGTNPAFWAVANNAALGFAQYDSWLSAGLTDGDAAGALSSIGIDWGGWTADAGIEVTDGAVFWMSPDDAPGGDVVVAQLTVTAGTSGTMTGGMQGRSSTGEDWNADTMSWADP